MATSRGYAPPIVESKKRDDFKPRNQSTNMRRFVNLFRRKRIAIALIACWLLYIFVNHIPTDLPPVAQRIDSRYGRLGGGNPFGSIGKPKPDSQSLERGQTYDGQVRFLNLARTLRKHATSSRLKSQAIFAFSSLQGASQIVPLACDMSQHNLNDVHVAIMGRQEVELDNILTINGLEASDCRIIWHDARPDFALQSSDDRMRISVRAAVGYIYSALRPDVIIVDNNNREDEFFTTTMAATASELGVAVITLPGAGRDSVSWIAWLSGVSLRQWHRTSIELVIHASSELSGSFIRLLRSIVQADYRGFQYPRITIEIPAEVDDFTLNYLTNLQWPINAAPSDSRLTVRRRVQSKQLSPAQASLKTIESFYPRHPGYSHVLVLSKDVELSSNYFQFLMFTILRYKYLHSVTPMSASLVGVSLELPSENLDEKSQKSPLSNDKSEQLILWQAPNSNAGLYFGDKWIEMHEFISKRLEVDENFSQVVDQSAAVSDRYPAWMKAMLELMQARGYYMLYPTVAEHQKTPLATLHHELLTKPEEYIKDGATKSLPSSDEILARLSNDKVLKADKEFSKDGRGDTAAFSGASVTSLLGPVSKDSPDTANLDFPVMPLYLYSGDRVDWGTFQEHATSYAELFATTIGGCTSAPEVSRTSKISEMLFCRSG